MRLCACMYACNPVCVRASVHSQSSIKTSYCEEGLVLQTISSSFFFAITLYSYTINLRRRSVLTLQYKRHQSYQAHRLPLLPWYKRHQSYQAPRLPLLQWYKSDGRSHSVNRFVALASCPSPREVPAGVCVVAPRHTHTHTHTHARTPPPPPPSHLFTV